MSINLSQRIYPCSFSKSYSIPANQAWSLLKIFFIYRFIISVLFILLFYSQYSLSIFLSELSAGKLFFYSSHFYFLFSIIAGVCAFKRSPSYPIQAQIVIFTDILFITLLMHAGGGINSGIGILLVVSIAASGLLIGGRCSLIFAALAGLSVIAEQIYAFQIGDSTKTSFVYAGALGTTFFALTYLSHVIVKRTEQSEILTSQHEQTIFKLEELNQYIIQHLQSGIIICNSLQQIKTINEAALTLCKYQNTINVPTTLSDISSNLVNGFRLWTMDSHHNFALIKLADESEIQVRFSLLQTQSETFHMIILEDSLLHNQRLQQSKLASLGCLTASIAHEIRNPLGAISHAGQLLAEAPNLSSQDQRLTTIIQSHCQRVNKIIEDILQLSRRSPSRKEKIDINPWIKSYLTNFNQMSNNTIDPF